MKKLMLVFAAFVCMGGFTSTARAISLNIDIGDQPYYTYGPRYWARGAYWCWSAARLRLALCLASSMLARCCR